MSGPVQGVVQVWFSILPVDSPFKLGVPLLVKRFLPDGTQNLAWISAEDWIGLGTHVPLVLVFGPNVDGCC